MKGKSNVFYVADLILCGLALLFTCKYIGVYHRPFVFSLFMAVVPVVIRANISYLFKYNEKVVRWPLLIFFVLSGWSILSLTYCDDVLCKMANWFSYVLIALDITDTPFYHVGNHRITSDVFVESTCGIVVLLTLSWFYFLPIIQYIVKLFGSKFEENIKPNFLDIICAYRNDKQMKKYLVYYSFVFIAFMVGSSMPLNGWALCVIFFPLVAYYVICRLNNHPTKLAEYILLLVSTLVLWYTQYYRNELRIIGLSLNAAMIVWLCFSLHRRLKKWNLPLFLSLFVGWLLPNLSLGYNIYAEIHTSRIALFECSVSRSGVLRVMSDKGCGLRDRHRVILEPEYETFYVEDYHSDFIRVRKNGVWLMYDVNTQSWVGESTIDMDLQKNVTELLKSELQTTGAKLGRVIGMETNTGEIKAMTGWDYRHSLDGYYVNFFNEPTLSELYSTAAILNTVEKVNLTDNMFGLPYKSFLTDSLTNFYEYVAMAFGKDIPRYRNQLRSLGYGLPITIPTLTRYNEILHTMSDNVSGDSVDYLHGFSAKSAMVSPIQLLAFYNGIANKGIMFTPMLEVNQGKITVRKMASNTAIETVQNILKENVDLVASHYNGSDTIDAAGRFSLAESDVTDWDTMKYRMEFCGYFPSKSPQYTVLIILEKDDMPAKAEFVYPLLQKLIGILKTE